MSDRFHGLQALLLDQRRDLKNATLFVFLVALTVSGAARFVGVRAEFESIAAVLVILTVIAPLLPAARLTLSGVAQPLGRREIMLSLPVGRWALPTAVWLSSFVFVSACFLAVFLGVTLTNGPGPVQDLLREATERDSLLPCPGLLLGFGWVAITSLATVGAVAQSVAFLAPASALFYGLLTQLMGHSEGDARAFLHVSLFSLAAYLLVLPFYLYGRGAHHWAVARKGDIEHADAMFGVGALAAVPIVATFGLGWGSFWTIAFFGWCWWSTRRKSRASRRITNTRVSLLLLLPFCVPPVACTVISEINFQRMDPSFPAYMSLAPSPDGKFAALPIRHAASGRTIASQAVAVVDLQGERPLQLLPARSGRIAGWSVDGRYLAVHDHSVGRLIVDGALSTSHALSLEPNPRLRAADAWLTNRTTTLIVDTHTGEVERWPHLEVAPGWRTPDELLQLDATLAGELRFFNDALDLTEPCPTALVGYLDGAPVVTSEVAEPDPALTRDPNYFGRGARVWRDGAWEALREGPRGWVVTHEPSPADDSEHARGFERIVLTLGDVVLRPQSVVNCWLLPEGRALLRYEDGWSLLDPQGEQTRIPASQDYHAIRLPGGELAFREGETWRRVRPSGELSPPVQLPEAVSIVAWPDERGPLVQQEGATSTLVRWAGDAKHELFSWP